MNKIDFKKIIGFSLLFLGLIFVTFLHSGSEGLQEFINSHDFFQVLIYFTLSYIIFFMINMDPNISLITGAALTWFSCLLFKVCIDYAQPFLPSDLEDLSGIGQVGILLGVLLFYAINSIKEQTEEPEL